MIWNENLSYGIWEGDWYILDRVFWYVGPSYIYNYVGTTFNSKACGRSRTTVVILFGRDHSSICSLGAAHEEPR